MVNAELRLHHSLPKEIKECPFRMELRTKISNTIRQEIASRSSDYLTEYLEPRWRQTRVILGHLYWMAQNRVWWKNRKKNRIDRLYQKLE